MPPLSWADFALRKLGYDARPAKLQLIIRTLYDAIAARGFPSLAAAGTEVHAIPLFHVLDGKDPADYVQRVEPSVQGGKKLADAILGVLLAEDAPAAIRALGESPRAK